MRNNKSNSNRAADISPTAAERTAAATTPIWLAMAKTAAIAQASHAAHADDIAAAAQATAKEIGRSLTLVVEYPTMRNTMQLIDSLAKSIHIVDIAAEHGIIAPKVKRYATDYNARYLAGLFLAMSMAIFVAHESRDKGEFSLASLYADATTSIHVATRTIPVTEDDAAAVTAAIEAMHRTIINV